MQELMNGGNLYGKNITSLKIIVKKKKIIEVLICRTAHRGGRWFANILQKIDADVPHESLGLFNRGNIPVLLDPPRSGVVSRQGQGQAITEFFQHHVQVTGASPDILPDVIGIADL